jgi:hypothetical protein
MADPVLPAVPAGFRPLKVGDGHGFVVDGREPWRRRLVITAGHCLPGLPTAVSFSAWHEKTYDALLGAFDAKCAVRTECLFVDPIADIAVLGSPDARRSASCAAAGAPARATHRTAS